MDRPQFRSVLASALARAGGLELATPRMTAGIDGRRTGRRSGNALEFSEYREYQAGDDLRRLDWGVFARSEQLMVKLYSEEVDPRCDIVLDDSASMATEEAKAAAALGLAGLLAQAAANAGFSLAGMRVKRLRRSRSRIVRSSGVAVHSTAARAPAKRSAVSQAVSRAAASASS